MPGGEPLVRPLRGGRWAGPFASLQHREFRYVWSSEMLHLWATEMENLVLAWFILTETNSPLQVGLIGAARFGGTLLAPLYGAIVDRFDRRAVQVFARAVSVVLAAVLMTLVLTDAFLPWHAFAIVGISSLVRTLGIVASLALSADTVPPAQLNNAMGLNRATTDLSRITGSLLGGGMMSTLGLGPAYIAVVSLYLAATLAAVMISARPRPALETADEMRSRPGYFSQINEGLAYVRERSVLAGLLFFAFLIEFTTFPLVNELMAVLGEDLFGTDENGVGIMRATASGGALVGALFTGTYRGIRNPSRLLVVAVIAWHLLTIPLVVEMSFGAALVILFAWGLFAGVSFVALMVGIFNVTRLHMRGRVMGLRALAVYGLPLGLLMGGWLAEEFGVRVMITTHSITGIAMTLLALIAWPALWTGSDVEEAVPGVASTTGSKRPLR